MAYGKYKDLIKRTQSDRVLRDKAFEIASNQKCDIYKKGLASMVYKFFNKKYAAGSGINFISNHQLSDKLHKPIINPIPFDMKFGSSNI